MSLRVFSLSIRFDPLSLPFLGLPKRLPWGLLKFRLYSSGWQTFPRPPIMVTTTDICRRTINIGILMTLSSSVAQTTREKVYIETVYADRVENVYSDRIAKHTDRFAPGQPSREAYYCDSRGDCRIVPTRPIAPSQPNRDAYYCGSRGDCLIFPR